MRPRTILYTGKGGVGKTSVASCTARRLAATGLRTLVISTDPAHSLSESLQVPLGAEPVVAGEQLWGAEIDAQAELTRNWSGVRDWLGSVLIDRGIDRISAHELTVPPGMDELFSLLVLREQHNSGKWDAIVVDCAPTGETLRLLAFPDVARWWIDKVIPIERQLLIAATPIARSLLDVPLPGSDALADLNRLSANLIEMSEILRDRERCTVRLVMNPDRMVIGEAMRTFTYLNLYGYLTDAVLVNKVFGDDAGAYFAQWRQHQRENLELVRSAFGPLPVLEAPYLEREVIGAEMLDRLASSLFDGAGIDPGAVLHDAVTQRLVVGGDGATLTLALPLASKGEISLKKIGLELVVSVAGQRRTIALPPALAGANPTVARFENGRLEVSFDGGR
jgi:arsenite-transporting ATPase